MKSAIILVLAVSFLALIRSDSSTEAVSYTDIHKYLSESLKGVLNTNNVDMDTLRKFIGKHQDLAQELNKFAKVKKGIISDMPRDFFHGLIYPSVNSLHNYEMKSVDAYLENPKYQKNAKLYEAEFPKKSCYSANLTLSILSLEKSLKWDNWDPMQIYYGLSNVAVFIDSDSKTEIDSLQVYLTYLERIKEHD